MIIESIRDYFIKCPLISKDHRINVDYLGVGAVDYSIDSVPVEPVIKLYVDGGALKQYVFVFGSREYYGADTLQNMDNSGFYQTFSEWIEEQNKTGNFPILSGGKEVKSIEATTQGYLFDASEDTAKYQIQCRITYYEDK